LGRTGHSPIVFNSYGHTVASMSVAELAIINANVLTLNPEQPKAEAIAVQDGRIIAVGLNEQIRRHMNGKTQVVDAKNKAVFPGFVDCHVHMTGFGRSLQTLNLRKVRSIREMQQKLTYFAEKATGKAWILGGRWDHEKFLETRYPTRWDLDAAVADKPVFLIRVCGHTGVVNSKALQLADITKETRIDGGKIELDEVTGEPNGILRENAMKLVSRVIPKPSLEELEDACVLSCQRAVEAGVTCVHWITDSAEEIRIIQRLYYEGKLPLRVYLGISVDLLDELVRLGLLTGFGDDMVKIGFVKVFADGSLGARTAALNEPYSDKPDTSGMMRYTQDELNRLILKAHKAGLQLGVHAIGDRAVEAVLKAFEAALKRVPRKNHRHRIEHCSVLNPKLINRMKRLTIIASVQPHFVFSDFWVTDRLGKARARWVYPFKTLMRKGLVCTAGSDCPVEPISPLLGIWAATTRKNYPEESLTVEEALKMYTTNAAYVSFDEKRKGTIEKGKLADLTILSDDPCAVSTEEIKDVSVKMVIVDGRVVYAKE
jgi:predicted amidohydrolase YtcJ